MQAHCRYQKCELTPCCSLLFIFRSGFSHFPERATFHSPAKERGQTRCAVPIPHATSHFSTPAVGDLCEQVALQDLACAGLASSVLLQIQQHNLSFFLKVDGSSHSDRIEECLIHFFTLGLSQVKSQDSPPRTHPGLHTQQAPAATESMKYTVLLLSNFQFHVAKTAHLFISFNSGTFCGAENQQGSRCQRSLFP